MSVPLTERFYCAEERGRGCWPGQADQAAGQRRQVRQAEEGGAPEKEGCGQGEEVRMVELYCFARACSNNVKMTIKTG